MRMHQNVNIKLYAIKTVAFVLSKTPVDTVNIKLYVIKTIYLLLKILGGMDVNIKLYVIKTKNMNNSDQTATMLI